MPTYFLTGANRGIGLEFVEQLSADPRNNILAGVRSRRSDIAYLKALRKARRNIHMIECDVSSTDSISSLEFRVAEILSRTGSNLDYIFNVAAINNAASSTSLNLDPVSFQAHMTTNVVGPAKIVETLQPFLARGAVVVNLTSGLASLSVAKDGGARCATYAISKAALHMLSLHQARDLRRNHAIVICMDPGWVKTRMGGKGAMVEPKVSIAGMLDVVRELRKEDSGKFLRFDGSEVPW
ncbi:NAD(P)-binding protein [Massarina eburnea CBS 473.64]|uniref:NAD(P)-binding protein n=1 Tax=Massarina eburnea CBS 473.64 TaxID=1395130 RepID=A0A6A6RTP8_9PLEO|nr:NAD(P)-binding protein [Massarina eburnea CBS 473.64]